MTSSANPLRRLARQIIVAVYGIARRGYRLARRTRRKLRRTFRGGVNAATTVGAPRDHTRAIDDLPRKGTAPKAADIQAFGRGRPAIADIKAADKAVVSGGRESMRERVILAEAALKAGHLSTAMAISESVLAHHPGYMRASAVHTRAADRAEIARAGWAYPDRKVTPYDPDPRAVLSVLSQSLPIRAGGYSTRSHGTLVALAQSGWRISALTRLGFPYDRWPKADPRVVAEVDQVDGIDYRRALTPGQRVYPQHPLRDYVDGFRPHVVRAAIENRAALIHASSYYQTGLSAAEAARELGLPFIYEIRGLHDILQRSSDPAFEGTLDDRFLRKIELEVCRLADHVLVITPSLLDELELRGIPRSKMSVLPNGVHTADFVPTPRDTELERQLGYTDKTVIGYLGGFVPHEGLEALVDAMATISAERRDVALLMVGDGECERSLRAQVADRGLEDVVTFTGRVPHQDIPRYLSLVDITPFPRQPIPVCELISPMKPFEAMAMAKAVVVSDVAALTDIVQDGRTGLAFRKGETADLVRALRELLNDAALRERLGAAAREWVLAERDWTINARAADAAYRSVLGS